MSAPSATLARPPADTAHAASGWIPYAFITLLLAATMLWIYATPALEGRFPDTDDAMRMVEVQDFIGGQAWFDTVEKRLAPPGVEMHWSRLVDVPIAALTLAFSLATDRTTAERLAAIAWPLIMLAIALAILSRLIIAYAGRDALLLGLGMVATSFCVWNYFPPGRVDHHNVQLALGLGYVLQLANLNRRSAAFFAGALAAAMAAVGMESLTWIIAGTAWLAGTWIVEGDRRAGALGDYGLAVALGAAGFLLLQRDPADLLVERCDALSVVHVVPAILGGAGLVILGRLRLAGRRARLAGMALVTGVALGATLLVFPQCARGPYAELPPELVARWLSGVGESRSVLQVAATDIGMLSQYTVAAFGLAAAIALAVGGRDGGRGAWLLIATVVGVSLVAGLVQVRAVVPATVLASIPLAAVAGQWKGRLAARPALSALAFLAGLFAGSTFAQAIFIEGVAQAVRSKPAAPKALAACLSEETIAALAALPRGLVLAPIDVGPAILYLTPHRVEAAPYHRNAAGNLAILDFFAAAPDAARAIAAKLDANYLLFCPGQPGYEIPPPGSLDADLRGGHVPPWLAPAKVSGDDSMKLFRIVPTD